MPICTMEWTFIGLGTYLSQEYIIVYLKKEKEKENPTRLSSTLVNPKASYFKPWVHPVDFRPLP